MIIIEILKYNIASTCEPTWIPHQNNGTMHPSYINYRTRYIQPVIQQYEIKSCLKNLCNQSSPYKNYGQFLLRMKAITCLPQNQYFSQ